MSGFGTTPVSTTSLGANQFPLTAVAVPGEASGNLTALEGADENTDSNGNKLASACVYIKDGSDVSQGAIDATAVTDPTASASEIALLKGLLETTRFVQYHILQGHGFSATTGSIATGANNAFVCMQLAVNAISKKVLIYDIVVANSNVTADGRIYVANVATADSNLSELTAYNMQPKSATTSAITSILGSGASTTQTSGFTGNQAMSYATGGDSTLHILQQGNFFYFANGDTASVEVANKVPTSGNNGLITFSWIEW